MRRLILLLSLLAMLAAPAAAGFSVRPTALYLTAPGAVTMVYLKNNSRQANVYQVGAAEWVDRSRPTAVAPTGDIVVSPRVLRLGPGQSGRVRIQAARPGVAGSGKAYRILARQVAPRRPGGDLTVRFNVQFNVPLLTARSR